MITGKEYEYDQNSENRYLSGNRYGEIRQRLIPITNKIIRCITSKKQIREDADSLIIEKKQYPHVNFTIEETPERLVLKTEKVWVSVDLQNGKLIWLR